MKEARLLEAEDWLLLEETPAATETAEVRQWERVTVEATPAATETVEALPMEVEMGSCLAEVRQSEGAKEEEEISSAKEKEEGETRKTREVEIPPQLHRSIQV